MSQQNPLGQQPDTQRGRLGRQSRLSGHDKKQEQCLHGRVSWSHYDSLGCVRRDSGDSAMVRYVNALSIDREGNLVVDGRIVESATANELVPPPEQDPVSEFIVRKGSDAVARFDPSWGGDKRPTLYLKGRLYWPEGPDGYRPQLPLTAPQGPAFILRHTESGNPVIQAYLDNQGNLVLAGKVFIGDDPDPMGIKTVGPTGSDSDYEGETGIQDAINAVPAHTVIMVKEGTYAPINFNGKNVVVRSTNPWDLSVVASTIIDGSLTVQDDPAVTLAGSESEECALMGLTITGGSAEDGAGVYSSAFYIVETQQYVWSHARILYNHICDNHASDNGGGIARCDGLIEGNIIGAYYEGDAGNSATSGAGLYECDGIIRKNVIVGNEATWDGGGLASCSFVIEQNYIACNTAASGGGAAYCGSTAAGAAIRSNVVYSNVGTEEGGGLYDCAGLIENNTVYGNAAPEGQGGGLMFCYYFVAAIRNNIVWGNSGGQVVWCVTPSYCCIQDWQGGGTGNIDDDPLFLSTDPGDGWDQFLHLEGNSPCIDAGDPDPPTEEPPPDRDFDDQMMPVDIEGKGTEYEYPTYYRTDDIGADEYPTQDPGVLVYWWERFVPPEDCP